MGNIPRWESGGVIQENGLPCRRHADFAMQVNPGFRSGGGKGQEGRYGASGAAGKKMVSGKVVVHRFFEWWLTAVIR